MSLPIDFWAEYYAVLMSNHLLKNEVKELEAEIKKLKGNFSHFHVANHVDDACALCSLDLRNEVHLRSR